MDQAAGRAAAPAHPTVVAAASAPGCPSTSGAADVGLGGAKAVAIAAHDERACAVLDDRSVMCWGNDMWERPDADTARHASPEPAPLGRVAELALGPYAGCARLVTGALSCWPHAGAQFAAPGPLPTEATGTMAIGLGHACAIRGGGVFCDGDLVTFVRFRGAWTQLPGVSRAVQIAADEASRRRCAPVSSRAGHQESKR